MSDNVFTVEIGSGVPLRAGDDWNVLIPLTNEDGTPFAWPVDATARMHLRTSPSAASPALALSTAESELALEAGGLRVIASSAQTSSLAAGSYAFDVELTVSGIKDTFIAGAVFVATKITRGTAL